SRATSDSRTAARRCARCGAADRARRSARSGTPRRPSTWGCSFLPLRLRLDRLRGGDDVQVVRLDRIAVAEDRRALDAVLQLADVARPVVGPQDRPRVAGHLQARPVQLTREADQKVID